MCKKLISEKNSDSKEGPIYRGLENHPTTQKLCGLGKLVIYGVTFCSRYVRMKNIIPCIPLQPLPYPVMSISVFIITMVCSVSPHNFLQNKQY